MEIKIHKLTKIYIVAPANFATWWPELLHQLAYKLKNNMKYDNVFMFYVPLWKYSNPVHKEYDNYNIPYTEIIEDNENNLIIVPEVFTKILLNYKKINKAIWWLSIDNYYLSIWHIKSRINKFILNVLNSQKYLFFEKWLSKIPFHIVQSEYARVHLLDKWIPLNNIWYISDYLNKDFLKIETNILNKENIISYNPKKWYKFTKKLIDFVKNEKKDNNIKFVPIENMTRQEVINLLQKSKIYIDFWFFPWKDRIPREAVILWNSILISQMWSWLYYADFPIDWNFKLKNLKDLELIYMKILDMINNYTNDLLVFEEYKNNIAKEEEKFLYDIKKIFI